MKHNPQCGIELRYDNLKHNKTRIFWDSA